MYNKKNQIFTVSSLGKEVGETGLWTSTESWNLFV